MLGWLFGDNKGEEKQKITESTNTVDNSWAL